MPKLGTQPNMKKMCFAIPKPHYFFLKEQALKLQKQNQKASISSLVRYLIEKDFEQKEKEEKKKGRQK